jgi:hypothetical protein
MIMEPPKTAAYRLVVACAFFSVALGLPFGPVFKPGAEEEETAAIVP